MLSTLSSSRTPVQQHGMDKDMSEFTLLPSTSIPEGAPKPELGENEHLEVYGSGEERAIVTVCRRAHDMIIKKPWLSAQETSLAQKLFQAIRARHLTLGTPLFFSVDDSQPVLSEALEGNTIAARIMTKPVDRNSLPPSPDGVRPRHMTGDELAAFLEEAEVNFAKAVAENSADPTDLEPAKAKAKTAFETVVPQRGRTPGHSFFIMEDDKGTKIGTLWLALNEETKQSFCYGIAVEAEKRRMGFGTKMLAIWEVHAAEQGAASLGLNVFGKNVAAQQFYVQSGFSAASTTFLIGGVE